MGLRMPEKSSKMGSLEQRMKMAGYAVLTLFFAVIKTSAKSCDSRKGMCARELRRIIRRSHPAIPKFTLLITLLLETRNVSDYGWNSASVFDVSC